MSIPEVLRVEPKVFGDARGYFFESYSAERYAAAGIGGPFVQDNLSRSRRGVLRGLHFQQPHAQGKLVSVVRGAVFDVAVDVRVGSPTFGRWVGEVLSEENHCQLWVPPGFAHGFLVVSDEAVFSYKCSEYYRPETERSVRWDDPAIGIEWPSLDGTAVELSAKDRAAPALAAIAPTLLPAFDLAAR
jgi:dTDP-4-dehydrorhamnose 3,5-epimerase